MASINMKSSVLAVVVESNQGDPVAPTSADEFVALRSDSSMTPNFETLENDELKASIAPGKPIIGSETPQFTTSHYLRHSGVEGQRPEYGDLLKAFFGYEHDRATERDTVAGSTGSAINVDVGEGVEFEKGHVMLVKDSSNGYRIRFVESQAADVINPSFNLPAGPASGVGLGQGISYTVANTDHQSLSIWHYLGNGGAIQMLAGGMVTGFNVSANARELIDCSFTVDGLGYYRNPVEIGVGNGSLDFNDGGGELNAQVAAGMYKDPHDLAAAIQTAMDGLTADNITVSYSDTTGKYTIATDGASLSLLWSTGLNAGTSIGETIGFDTVSDDSAALSYEGDSEMDWAAEFTPSYDVADPNVAKNNEVMLGDADDYACFHASTIQVSGTNTKSTNGDICAESGQGTAQFNARSVEVTVSALLDKHQVGYFSKFRQGSEVRFQYSFGPKSGGNWVPGKCGALYISSATISSYSIVDADGLVQLDMTLTAFANSTGDGEIHLGFV